MRTITDRGGHESSRSANKEKNVTIIKLFKDNENLISTLQDANKEFEEIKTKYEKAKGVALKYKKKSKEQ